MSRKIEHTCIQCGIKFYNKDRDRKFCKKSCYDKSKVISPSQEQIDNLIRIYDEGRGVPVYKMKGMTGFSTYKIRLILSEQGINVTRMRKGVAFSEEHINKIREANRKRAKNNPSSFKPKKPKSEIDQRILVQLKNFMDLSPYTDLGKLKSLATQLRKRKAFFGITNEVRRAFIERFYYDLQFNIIYDLWVQSGKNKWLFPSLDHIIPLSRGGTYDLNNLQFLTWFENKAKAEMTQEEWNEFRINTNTRSDFFMESILKNHRLSFSYEKQEHSSDCNEPRDS